jgi:hypothetical protein
MKRLSGFVLKIKTASDFSAFTKRSVLFSTATFFPGAMKHEDIRWNRTNGEWFCAKCGRISQHMVKEDAQAELEEYECNLPVVNPKGKPVASG